MHRRFSESTLGALDVEAVLAEDVENGAKLLQVCCPGSTVHQYIIKKNKDAPAQERLEDEVHECLERGRRI